MENPSIEHSRLLMFDVQRSCWFYCNTSASSKVQRLSFKVKADLSFYRAIKSKTHREINMSSKTAAVAATAAATTATIFQRTKPKFRYLSAWFCPYAHRATIALEYHKAHIDYEWVEALGWYQKETNAKGTDTNDTAATPKDNKEVDDDKVWYYHWKADELKRVNPSALVPTLIPINIVLNEQQQAEEVVDESRAVYESLVTIDYIDMVANNYRTSMETTPHSDNSMATTVQRLVPFNDPYEYARCRIWVDKVNRECCSPYYDILVRQDPTERQLYFQKLLSGIQSFTKELKKTSGPTFLSDGQVCSVDIALFPWAYRFYVLQHYCGTEFVIPPNDPIYEPYHTWYQYMLQMDYVQRTLPNPDQYLDHIQKYANGTARSKVANAVRRGVAAHELDDVQDEYK
jgi:glutathione S-transferase